MADSFPVQIKALRETRGWTQEDLANKMGVSQQSVQKWESGRAVPRESRQQALLTALGADAARDKARARRVSPAEATPRLGSRTRREAFFAELDTALPEHLSANIAPDYADAGASKIRYQSSRVPRADGQPACGGLAANFIVSDQDAIDAVQYAWVLSTERQIDIQLIGDDRKYVLFVLAACAKLVLAHANSLVFDASMHGIDVVFAHTVADIVKVIVDTESETTKAVSE